MLFSPGVDCNAIRSVLEDLAQVSELLPPCAATANLLSSVPQTLDDASFYPGRVVGVKVEVSVRMCLLAKD